MAGSSTNWIQAVTRRCCTVLRAAADGLEPYAGVVRDSAGNLYGATYSGGTGYGVAYKIDAAGNETVLHNFTSDGGGGYAGLVLDSAGNLYGAGEGGVSGGGAQRRPARYPPATNHTASNAGFPTRRGYVPN